MLLLFDKLQKAAMLAQQEIRRRVLDLRRMQLERLLDMQVHCHFETRNKLLSA